MAAAWKIGAAVYVAGVIWGFLATDARPLARVGLAILWPIGPAAFLVTSAILLAVLPVAYPVVGMALLVAAGVLWWVLA